MYKPPIEVFTMIENQIENERNQKNEKIKDAVLSEVLRIGINVDKEQLLRALSNEREQYKAGFEDGKRYILKKIKESLSDISDIVDELDME